MITRLTIVILMLLSVLTSSVIEMFHLKLMIQIVFLLACTQLCMTGILGLSKQNSISVQHKILALIGVVFAGSLAFRDLYHDQFYPDAYKFSVIFALIFFGSELQRRVNLNEMVALLWGVLTLYTLFSMVMFLTTGGFGGEESGSERINITGSVTLQGIIMMTYTLMTYQRILVDKQPHRRFFYLLLMLPAIYMMMIAGSRQVLIIGTLFMVFLFFLQHGLFAKARILSALAIGVAVFFIFSYTVDDTLYSRLFYTPLDTYTTGRLYSMALWLEIMQREGPLGLGYIGNHVDYTNALLWPHNEFIRFYVEGGIFGVGIVFLLFFHALHCLYIVLRYPASPHLKALTILIATETIVQVMLNNSFQAIYRISFLYLFLTMSASHAWALHSLKKDGIKLRVPNTGWLVGQRRTET